MAVVIKSIKDAKVTSTEGKTFIIDTASDQTAAWSPSVARAFTAETTDGTKVAVWLISGRLWSATSAADKLRPVIERWSETHLTTWMEREWPFLVALGIVCVTIVYGGKWALKKLH